jgi:hypothetical protein
MVCKKGYRVSLIMHADLSHRLGGWLLRNWLAEKRLGQGYYCLISRHSNISHTETAARVVAQSA